MNVIPGILEHSYEAIEKKIEDVSSSVTIVHIDICDGLFVPTKTWPYANTKSGVIEDNTYIAQLLSEDIGLPHWETLDFQFHLMIKNPGKTIDTWLRSGASTVLIHPSACTNFEECVEVARKSRTGLSQVGIAITYDEWMTYKDSITHAVHTGEFDILHIMTIAHIGMQKEPFDTRWNEELGRIRNLFPHTHIQVDGSVREETVDTILDAGIETAVIGSALFSEGNVTERIEYFAEL